MTHSSSFKSNCQAYIFNWPRVTQQAKQIEEQFTDYQIDAVVINSDDDTEYSQRPNWINIGADGFMIQQYHAAVNHFKSTRKKFFIGLFADVSNIDLDKIIERAASSYEQHSWGIYAPNIEYMYWNFDKNKLTQLSSNLYEVPNPECLFSILHKDVVKDLFLFPDRFTIGWGIDFLLTVKAKDLGLPVVRDYSILLHHPRGSNYNFDKAKEEYLEFIDSQDEHISELMKAQIKLAESLVIKEEDSMYASWYERFAVIRKRLKI